MILDSLVNKPNRVPAKQRAFQTSHVPIYVRGPRARLYYGLYLVGWSAGLLGTVAGMWSLVQGKPSA